MGEGVGKVGFGQQSPPPVNLSSEEPTTSSGSSKVPGVGTPNSQAKAGSLASPPMTKEAVAQAQKAMFKGFDETISTYAAKVGIPVQPPQDHLGRVRNAADVLKALVTDPKAGPEVAKQFLAAMQGVQFADAFNANCGMCESFTKSGQPAGKPLNARDPSAAVDPNKKLFAEVSKVMVENFAALQLQAKEKAKNGPSPEPAAMSEASPQGSSSETAPVDAQESTPAVTGSGANLSSLLKNVSGNKPTVTLGQISAAAKSGKTEAGNALAPDEKAALTSLADLLEKSKQVPPDAALPIDLLVQKLTPPTSPAAQTTPPTEPTSASQVDPSSQANPAKNSERVW
jgi:hypothetical protein